MEKNLFIHILENADRQGNAVGAVNIFNHITAESAIFAANGIKQNAIIQTSANTVRRFGADNLFYMIDSVRKCVDVKIALHLDHCRDTEIAMSCIKAGWDSIMMDYSHLCLEENIYYTRRMADFAHQENVAIEGEVGIIAGEEDDIVSDVAAGAKYGETIEFIEKTAIDAIAPSIGTAHGVYKGIPVLDYGLVEALGKQEVPIVVHGGSGLAAESFKKLIQLGGRKINISTLVKNAYMDTISKLVKGGRSYSPIAFDDEVRSAVLKAVQSHLKVFSGIADTF